MNRETAHLEAQICTRLPILKKFIISKVGSGLMSEDIYGEAVLLIWRMIRRGKFNEARSIDALMYWYARSAISNYLYREHKDNSFAHNGYPDYCNNSAKSHEREYEIRIENRLFIEKMMGVLGVLSRKILILLLFQNMHQREIAETLNMRRATLSWHLNRMRNRFGLHLSLYKARAQKA